MNSINIKMPKPLRFIEYHLVEQLCANSDRNWSVMTSSTCETLVFTCEIFIFLISFSLLSCRPFPEPSTLVLFHCNEFFFIIHKYPHVQQTAKNTWCTSQIVMPDRLQIEDAVPYLSLKMKTPTVFLYGVCYWNVLVVLKHPQEHMVTCLHRQPVEAFSLPAWCAPVGLEKCHQQPARQAAQFCSHTSLLKEDSIMSQCCSTNNRLKEMWAVTKVIWVWRPSAADHLSNELK